MVSSSVRSRSPTPMPNRPSPMSAIAGISAPVYGSAPEAGAAWAGVELDGAECWVWAGAADCGGGWLLRLGWSACARWLPAAGGDLVVVGAEANGSWYWSSP